ncbi:MAG: type VI secretion system protein TssA, partial [Acetobacteraceae bacterium]
MPELPDGFDLDALLAPIPGDAPQGTDLRENFSAQSPYFRLRDSRSEARDAEKAADRGDKDPRDPTPLWRGVRDLGLKSIAEVSKDLEVAAWAAEALLRLDGLRGLTAGSLLMKGLAEQYWDALFPLPDDYGVETRVAPVTGLNGRDGAGSLIQPLYKLPLFVRADGGPVALYQWQQSAQLGTLDAARRKQRVDAGAVPLEDLEKEARAIPAKNFAQLRHHAREARAAWQQMAVTLDEKAGADGPSTSQVRDLLGEIIDLANRFAPPDEPEPEAEIPGDVSP